MKILRSFLKTAFFLSVVFSIPLTTMHFTENEVIQKTSWIVAVCALVYTVMTNL